MCSSITTGIYQLDADTAGDHCRNCHDADCFGMTFVPYSSTCCLWISASDVSRSHLYRETTLISSFVYDFKACMLLIPDRHRMSCACYLFAVIVIVWISHPRPYVIKWQIDDSCIKLTACFPHFFTGLLAFFTVFFNFHLLSFFNI